VESELQQWLTELFRSWNPQNVREIFDLIVEKGIPVFETEEQVDAFFARIPNHINSKGFINGKVIPRIPEEFNSKIIDKTDELIRNNNNNQQEIGLSIIEQHPKRFAGSFGQIIEQCGRQIKSENNSRRKKEILMPVAKQFSRLESPEQENFIGQMELLLRGNAGDYKAYKELWETFAEEADSDRKDAVFGDVLEEITQRISNNQNPDHLTPIIEILQSTPESLEKNQGGQFMERLSNRLTDRNLNTGQQETVLKQIAGFSEFYDKEGQILDRVESLLERSNNSKIRGAARDLVAQIEEQDDIDQQRIESLRANYLEQTN
jgi:hypothetical protein